MEQFILIPNNKINSIGRIARKGYILEVAKTLDGRYVVPISVLSEFSDIINEQRLGTLTIIELDDSAFNRTLPL